MIFGPKGKESRVEQVVVLASTGACALLLREIAADGGATGSAENTAVDG
jgi:hypothetical protein